MTLAIEAIGVSKSYSTQSLFGRRKEPDENLQTYAVRDVSLEVEDGKIFGLIGPNGAGKTTLIKLFSTLLRPSEGTIRICGSDVVEEERRVRQFVGLVTSNERSFYWRLSGRRNLEFFADLYRLERTDARRWTDELLSFLDLAKIADQPFGDYSTGTRQRFAIARGLLSKPRILLMDEPTKGVDPINAADITDLIRHKLFDLWQPTILITSHNLHEIEALCSRVAIMHRGHLVACGAVKELRASVGERETYTIEVGQIGEADLRTVLAGSPGLQSHEVTWHHGIMTARLTPYGSSGALDDVIRRLVTSGASILALQSHTRSFDSVFLSLIEGADREARGPDLRNVA